MFLQAGSGIDAGFVSLTPTLNCSFFNSAIDMRNGSANRFARKLPPKPKQEILLSAYVIAAEPSKQNCHRS
jgi:hypothetical protein